MTDPVGLVIFLGALFVGGWLAWLTVRLWRSGNLVDAMIRTTFLPEKRRQYIRILSVEGSAILFVALVWSAARLGLIPTTLEAWFLPSLLLVSVICVAAISELGMRAGELTEDEQEKIRRDAPEVLLSLASMPASRTTEGLRSSRSGWARLDRLAGSHPRGKTRSSGAGVRDREPKI